MEQHALDAPLIFDALLAAEDHRGNHHSGIDWFSIARALYRSRETKGIKGISTVEQQLVRTIFPRRGVPRWIRKVPECALATRLARRIPKTTIWAAYVHCAYYGRDYPSYAHVRSRFIQAAERLDTVTAARIVSCLKYPIPHFHRPRWASVHDTRTRYVLRRLSALSPGASSAD